VSTAATSAERSTGRLDLSWPNMASICISYCVEYLKFLDRVPSMAPAVEFPTGFPLIDGEVVERETAPGASDEQIEMLKRMMGGA